jgi:hypothetical protein
MPGIIDILFEVEDGVVVPLPFDFPGDFPANDEDRPCSGVPTFPAAKCVWPCLDGGCKDFVFAARDAVNPLAPSVYVGCTPMFARVEAPAASANPWDELLVAKLGRLRCAGLV